MTKKESAEAKLGFLDGIVRLFRRSEAAPAPAPEGQPLEELQRGFAAAIRELNQTLEEQRSRRGPGMALGPAPTAEELAAERVAERARRLAEYHRTMREDITRAHADLSTGMSGDDLEPLASFLRELDELAKAGAQSDDLLARARHAIAKRLHEEAGQLAVAQLVARLRDAQRAWPDPTRHRPSATPEEIERSSQRRLREVREGFLQQGLARTAERMLGVVAGWGADYPDRGSPLWEECALEGVAAGMRARLLRDFVEVLRKDRDELVRSVEGSVGKHLGALQQALHGGVRSFEEATAAVSGAMRVIDEMVPETAWRQVCAELPEARGEVAR